MTETLPILMIPGLNCSARLYQHQIAALWPIAPVMVANHTKTNDIKHMAEYIIASAPKKFNLVGLSMGGYLCFEILRQAQKRVEKLVLIDTSARADTEEQTSRRERTIKMAFKNKFEELDNMMWPVLVDKSHVNNVELHALVNQMAKDTGPEAFINQQRTIISRPDSREFLKFIKPKTMVIVGEGDQLTPPDIAKEMADGIPGATLEIIPDCGHLSAIEQPEKVSELLVRFFKS